MPDIKIKKDGEEYDIGVIPQSMYDDVEDLKDAINEKVSDNPTFTEAQTRANIASGETFATILGKIKKWFTDLPSMFVSKSGDTMSGSLTIDKQEGWSYLTLGNSISQGTNKNSAGCLRLYGLNQYKADFYDNNRLTANRNYQIPDKSGTLALTSDIPTHGEVRFLTKYTSSSSGTLNFSLSTRSSGLIFVNRNAASASIYAFYSTSNTGNYSFVKIAGSDLTITCTDTKDINVTVNNYSNVTLMAVGADIT